MGKGGNDCCCRGPGYANPLDAFRNGPREKIAYIPAVQPRTDKPDYLMTVDLDPHSSTYSQVIHRLPMTHKNDELHHSGWNACSSCHDDSSRTRSLLILPAVGSGRIYAVDTATDPKAPRIAKTAEPEDIQKATGLAYLHSSHCLGSGDIMVSAMGTPEGKGVGNFILFDQDLKVKGTWTDTTTEYGYDFWYQPRHNVMVSSQWGDPLEFTKGFNPAKVPSSYGDTLTFWDWQKRTITQQIKLGAEGLIPLETRFLHEPSQAQGYVGAALSSNVIRFSKDGSDKWETSVVIKQPWTKVENWVLPEVPPLITDILISLDDKFLYFSNWLRGDLVQYDISDPANPKFASRIWLGGVVKAGGPIKVTGGLPDDTPEIPTLPQVKGHTLEGGPQMIQLSLDGKRLYVTNSLFSSWDKQFYPDMIKQGSYLLQIDVDTDKGGLTLNPNFYIDFGAEPDGPVLAHEVRYPGGDCSSDIWL
ncbi:Methanethiol oxidase [Trebouxia sp. C0009 RCD-2024]